MGLIAKPRCEMTTEQIIRLIFKRDTARIKSDYDSVGWFNEMIIKMKGEFEVIKTENTYIIPSKIDFSIISDEFEEYYEVYSSDK